MRKGVIILALFALFLLSAYYVLAAAIDTVNIYFVSSTDINDTLSNNTNTNKSSLTFVYNYTGANISGNCSLFINGVQNTTNASTINNTRSNFTTAPGTFPDGAYTWNLTCLEGNTPATAITAGFYNFTIDRTAPTEPTPSTPSNQTRSNSLNPTFDWATVTETNFQNYTVQVAILSNFSPLNYTFNISGRADSNVTVDSTGINLTSNLNWYWRVIAYDTANNAFTGGSFIYTTDTVVPVASSGSPTGTVTTITPSISVSTDENATCKYSVNLDEEYSALDTTFSNTGNRTHNTTSTDISLGTNTFYVRCRDTAGNTMTSSYSWSLVYSTGTTDSGGGGGGGGGGDEDEELEVVSGQTKYLGVLETASTLASIAESGSIKFEFNGSNFTLNVVSVNLNSVDFDFDTINLTLNLAENTNTTVDLNHDAFDDLYLELTSIDEDTAHIELYLLERIDEEIIDEVTEDEQILEPSYEIKPSLWVTFFVLFAIIVAIGYYFIIRFKHRRQHGWQIKRKF